MPKEFATDEPITSSADDKFSRKQFAQRVAHTIAHRADPSSIVVGIYGAWGEGKTSVLRMIDEALADEKNVTAFWFNPWRYADEEALLESFFRLMAAALGTSLSSRTEEIGELLGRYSKYVKPLVDLAGGPVGISSEHVDQLVNALSDTDADTLKERIDARLAESGTRLVVLLDDLDRLDQVEIRAVFRLIKLTLSFKNSAFVVAFDDEVVTEALHPQYGASSRNFLEKIIQVPLQLPRADPLVLRKFCFAGVDEAIRLADVELADSEARRFVQIFDRGFLPKLTTPRTARRYANTLMFALPILAGEVNVVDLLLVEAVRLFYPRLYTSIRGNRDLYVWSVMDHVGQKTDEFKNSRKEKILSAVADLHPSERDAALHVVQSLFPLNAQILGNGTGSTQPDERWTTRKRVASPEYFDRYFGYGISATDISDREFAAFCEKLDGSDDNAEVANDLQRFASEGRSERFLEKARQAIKDLPTERCGPFARAISRNSDLFVGRNQLGLFSLSESAAARVCWLIERAATPDRHAIALECVRCAQSLMFAVELLRWLNPEGRDDEIIQAAEYANVGLEVAHRIAAAVEESPAWTVFGTSTASMLLVWESIEGRSTVWSHVRKYVSHNPRQALSFLESMLTAATSLETGDSFRRAFSRSDYNYVAAIADPEELAVLLRSLDIRPELGNAYEIPSDPARQSASRFLAIHEEVSQSAPTADGANDEAQSPE